MKIRGFLQELRRRNVFKIAVAYTATGVVLLEVLTHLFHNFEAPHWVLKVITTLLILGLPVACLLAWGFELKEGRVRSVPRGADQAKPALPAPEAAAAPPSIAVLPFEDMSPEQDQKYLGSGIAEELLNALAAIDQLKVAARTSSFSLAARGATMQEIGGTLHVRHVLEGSVRRSGHKLRVTAQLIDVENGFHLFSQAYDREAQDIFDIQNEIAREIARALLPKLGLGADALLVRRGTANLDAYNLRLKAHQSLVNLDPLTVAQPLDQLRQAIALDPAYADAWGDLAYLQMASTIWIADPVPLMMESYRAATTALSHEPDNVPALLVLGYVSMLVHRDPAACADYLQRARRTGVDLSLWATLKAAMHDGPLGRYGEAIAALEEAESKDPLAPSVRLQHVVMLLGAGRVTEAVAVADAALPLAAGAPALMVIATRAHLAAGNVRRARELLEAASGTTAVRFPGYPSLRIAFEVAAGNRIGAQALLDELLAHGVEERPSACYAIGESYLALGDYDKAIEWWTRSVERRENWSVYHLPALSRSHPVIGKDPRFLALLRRMGLEESSQ